MREATVKTERVNTYSAKVDASSVSRSFERVAIESRTRSRLVRIDYSGCCCVEREKLSTVYRKDGGPAASGHRYVRRGWTIVHTMANVRVSVWSGVIGGVVPARIHVVVPFRED